MQFGPVGDAALGSSSPSFDLITGFAVLAFTWISYFRKEQRLKINLSMAIGVTAICAVFISAGIVELLR